jgi:regulator of protease activity HflC (stomatin/prohibitin superfamily)
MSLYYDQKTDELHVGKMLSHAGLALVALVLAGMFGCPRYRVYSQTMEGQAELARAQQNRQIKVSEAEATEESAKHLANAEVARAEGVAKANAIIGESLRGNEAYLRWLYIEGLKENKGESIIYVPTEAGLPILEAGRFGGAR